MANPRTGTDTMPNVPDPHPNFSFILTALRCIYTPAQSSALDNAQNTHPTLPFELLSSRNESELVRRVSVRKKNQLQLQRNINIDKCMRAHQFYRCHKICLRIIHNT